MSGGGNNHMARHTITHEKKDGDSAMMQSMLRFNPDSLVHYLSYDLARRTDAVFHLLASYDYHQFSYPFVISFSVYSFIFLLQFRLLGQMCEVHSFPFLGMESFDDATTSKTQFLSHTRFASF
jgi:hypothetical protein